MAKWDLTRWQTERTSHWLLQTWTEGFQQVLAAGGAGASAEVRVVILPPDPEAWKQWAGPFWVSLDANVAAGARLAVGCPQETEQALAEWIGGEGLDTQSARQAYLGVIQHATELMAQTATERVKRPVLFAEAAEGSQPPYAPLGVGCHFSLGGAAHSLALAPNEVLLVTLLSEEGASAGTESTALAELSPDAGIIPELALSPHARQNLEMLLDVDLELSVSFGHTTLVLQDVLKLSSGSIVELNRSASDPVELLVNDAVIARGEVVVVEGNYGIRITEVVSPRERIRSLL